MRSRKSSRAHRVPPRSASIPERLLQYLGPSLRGRSVADLRLGLLYAAVRFADGATGVAHLLTQPSGGPCRPLRGAGQLAGTPAEEVARWVLSRDPTEASVGLAALNAAATGTQRPDEVGDIRDLLPISPSDRVAMIGYFAPLLPWLRKTGAHLDILDIKPIDDPSVRPAEDAAAVLPECDVALISATAIINHTLDGLLVLCQSARDIVLLGPSTPMVPQVFGSTAVTLLAGVEVTDGQGMLRIVSEGGSTRQFGPVVRKLCVSVRGQPDRHPAPLDGRPTPEDGEE